MGRTLLTLSLSLLLGCVQTTGRSKNKDGSDPVVNTFRISAATSLAAKTTSLAAGYGKPAPAACEYLLTSTCEGFVCPEGVTADGGVAEQPQQAGVLHLLVEGKELTLEPSVDGSYKTKKTGPMWAGGERVEFVADGGDVPAFQDAIDAPGALSLASPLPAGGQSVAIDRTKTFEFTWTGESEGSFFLGLMALTGRAMLQCRYTAATGHGGIPSSVLSDLPEGGYLMFAGAVVSSTAKVGGYTVTSEAATQTTIGGAAAASASLH